MLRFNGMLRRNGRRLRDGVVVTWNPDYTVRGDRPG